MSLRWSILLPTHKSPKTIEYAIKTALMQTESSFELLIVGDGCCDETRGVVSAFDDDRIRFFDLEKAAHYGYANRSVALQEAKGELIAFLSDDDLWFPDHLSILEEGFAEERVDLVCSQSVWITPEGLSIPLPMNLADNRIRQRFMTGEFNFLPAGCVAHRRRCFEEVGYWNDSLPSKGDQDLWIRILKNGIEKNFHYVPLATNLHFRAPWKTLANEGPSEMKYWREFIQNHEVPSILNCAFNEDCIEQQEFFSLISSEGETFVKNYRHSLSILIEISHRFERTQSVMLKKRFAELQATSEVLAERRREQEILYSELETIRSSYESIINSTSWKLAQKLQKLSSMLPILKYGKSLLKGARGSSCNGIAE